MQAGAALEPRPGDRVLDLCAAPGAKTTQLAALMQDDGSLVAVEHHPGRARALRRTLERMQVSCATVRIGDAEIVDRADVVYDRVLVDPPCSGLGTLQSRPDLRWRTSPERISGAADLQARVLRAGAALTRPGGRLVYSVCTISRAEGERVIEAFLAEQREFSPEPTDGAGERPWQQLMPHRDLTDGFFIARLRRG
jgi:16S rRNA (cytosine967-C5)-methyltransferase